MVSVLSVSLRGPALLFVSLSCLVGCSSSTETSRGVSFGRTWPSYDEAGELNPLVTYDLQSLTGGATEQFDLGAGRSLVLRDHVGTFEPEELAELAGVVRRCYELVEELTGLAVVGDTMYFLLPLDPEKHSYTFSYEASADEVDRFAWVGAVAFLPGEGVSRSKSYSTDLYDEVLLTLPHELTEGLLTSMPNLKVDIEGGVCHRTRWFNDGAAEYVSSEFARREFPELWAWDRFERSDVRTVMDEASVREAVLEWGSTAVHVWSGPGDTAAPVDEYRKYTAAQLLMEVWLQSTSLRSIVASIQASEQPVNGDVLLALMKEATGLNAEQFLAAARDWGRKQVPPEGG